MFGGFFGLFAFWGRAVVCFFKERGKLCLYSKMKGQMWKNCLEDAEGKQVHH